MCQRHQFHPQMIRPALCSGKAGDCCTQQFAYTQGSRYPQASSRTSSLFSNTPSQRQWTSLPATLMPMLQTRTLRSAPKQPSQAVQSNTTCVQSWRRNCSASCSHCASLGTETPRLRWQGLGGTVCSRIWPHPTWTSTISLLASHGCCIQRPRRAWSC